MSVVSIEERPRRPGEFTGESGNIERNWLILVNSKSDNPNSIAPSLPAYLAAHPDNAYLTCRSLRIKEVDGSWQYWEATAKYSSEPLSQREKERQEANPLDRTVKIRWSSRDEVEAVFVDQDGYAAVNSAGDYYDPPPERIVGNWTVTVEKNVSSVPAAILSYLNAVNSSSVTVDGITFPAGTLRIAAISIGETLEENGVTYRVFNITYECKSEHPVDSSQVLNPSSGSGATPDPWDAVILDQGLREKTLGTGSGTGTGGDSIVQIRDDEQNFVNSPVPLDGAGHRLAAPDPTNVKYFRHRLHTRLSFTGLPGVA